MKKITRIIEFGFYLFIFLLPWQTRLIWRDAFLNGFVWEYGRFSLYGTELLLGAVLFFYFIWLLKNRRLQKFDFSFFWQRIKQPAILIYWLIIIFILFSGLTIFWSLNAELTFSRWLVLVQAVALLSMVLLFDFKFKKIAFVWVSGAAIQGIFAIFQFFSQSVFANKWLGLAEHSPLISGSIILQTDNERWLRAYGSLPHPNILAGFLVIAVLFLFYLAFVAQKQSQRIFVLTSLVAIVPALFLTFSRSAWIAIILSLIILSFWLYQRKDYFLNSTFLKILTLSVFLVVILGVNLSGALLARFSGEQDLEINSLKLRMTFTQQAWQLIKDRPYLGVGIGNYTLAVYQKINASWPGYYYQPVHNLFLLVLAELGIVGAVIFYLSLGLIFWFSFKKTQEPEGIIIFLSLLSILIISLFDHYFWTIYFGVIVFWLILGLNLKRLR